MKKFDPEDRYYSTGVCSEMADRAVWHWKHGKTPGEALAAVWQDYLAYVTPNSPLGEPDACPMDIRCARGYLLVMHGWTAEDWERHLLAMSQGWDLHAWLETPEDDEDGEEAAEPKPQVLRQVYGGGPDSRGFPRYRHYLRDSKEGRRETRRLIKTATLEPWQVWRWYGREALERKAAFENDAHAKAALKRDDERKAAQADAEAVRRELADREKREKREAMRADA